MADYDVDGHKFDPDDRVPVQGDDGDDSCGWGRHGDCRQENCPCPCHRLKPEFEGADDHGYVGNGTSDCSRCYYPMNAHDPNLRTTGVDGTAGVQP